MATYKSNLLEMEHEDATENSDLDLDEISTEDIEVNIAIIGKAGSGRSSFVNAIRGLKENDRNAARKGECVETTSKESTSYSHPGNPNIKFSILPSIDQATFPAFQSSLDYAEIEKFDAFLIFTAGKFTKRHLEFSKIIKSSNKPLFFIRTKIDNDNHPEKRKEREIKVRLAKNLKELHCREYEIYLISNNHPNKWDFYKLAKAIADSLPSPQKEFFNKIPKIQELLAFKKFQNFLKETEAPEKLFHVDEIKRVFLESGIVGLVGLQRMMCQMKEVKINLAVLGNSGVGKSTFINAVRGVDDDDEVAAKTGVIGTTTIPTPYEHPSNPNIRFWDLPNIGTPNYPDLPTLCEKVAIEKYDRFLIICSTRFTENDLQLARKAQSLGKSFVFIRTMIDNDTRSEKRKLGKKFNEEKTLKKIRNDCVENLRNLNNGEGKIFLVSNYDPNKWDFDRLKKEILNPSPSKQNKSLTIPLPTRSKDILRESIKIFRDRVWMVAAASVASKFGLGPFCLFIDGKLIRKKFEFYSIQLEFPDNGSEEFQMLTEELQKKVEKFYQKPNQNRVDWLKSFDRDNTFNMRMYKKMMITKKPLVFVYRFLNLILDEMEETALAIVDEAAKRPWHADHEF